MAMTVTMKSLYLDASYNSPAFSAYTSCTWLKVFATQLALFFFCLDQF